MRYWGLTIVLLAVFVSACAGQQKHAKTAQETPQYSDPVIIQKVYFDTAKYDIREEEQDKITDSSDQLKGDAKKIAHIEGHADARGTEDYNLNLGDRRARSVKEMMVSQGVNPQQIIVVSFGEEKPAADNKTQEGMAENRRVEIKVR